MEFGTFLLLRVFLLRNRRCSGTTCFRRSSPRSRGARPRTPSWGSCSRTPCMPAEWMGPGFAGLHVVPMLLGSMVAVIVDWLVTSYRHPAAIFAPEMRSHHA